ncbi:tautomerase family protein [Orrella marina]|uniref:4-oxalocrotonate tautomerase n=1 Tax=Orrella marina TaxID=2163011 RepID=A0A2R4XKK6_9BURK|nr:tautomerase family protein [Orrella marina]AWB34310.1 4-oxalocrotonate tautomerase [Orrella marina]
MPILNIKIPTGHSTEQKKNLLKGLTDAVVASLAAPLPSIRVTIEEVAPDHTIVAGEIGKPMTLITAVLIVGRTPELKAALIKALAESVQATIGISIDDTRVVIQDIERTDLGVAGGISAKAAGR